MSVGGIGLPVDLHEKIDALNTLMGRLPTGEDVKRITSSELSQFEKSIHEVSNALLAVKSDAPGYSVDQIKEVLTSEQVVEKAMDKLDKIREKIYEVDSKRNFIVKLLIRFIVAPIKGKSFREVSDPVKPSLKEEAHQPGLKIFQRVVNHQDASYKLKGDEVFVDIRGEQGVFKNIQDMTSKLFAVKEPEPEKTGGIWAAITGAGKKIASQVAQYTPGVLQAMSTATAAAAGATYGAGKKAVGATAEAIKKYSPGVSEKAQSAAATAAGAAYAAGKKAVGATAGAVKEYGPGVVEKAKYAAATGGGAAYAAGAKAVGAAAGAVKEYGTEAFEKLLEGAKTVKNSSLEFVKSLTGSETKKIFDRTVANFYLKDVNNCGDLRKRLEAHKEKLSKGEKLYGVCYDGNLSAYVLCGVTETATVFWKIDFLKSGELYTTKPLYPNYTPSDLELWAEEGKVITMSRLESFLRGQMSLSAISSRKIPVPAELLKKKQDPQPQVQHEEKAAVIAKPEIKLPKALVGPEKFPAEIAETRFPELLKDFQDKTAYKKVASNFSKLAENIPGNFKGLGEDKAKALFLASLIAMAANDENDKYFDKLMQKFIPALRNILPNLSVEEKLYLIYYMGAEKYEQDYTQTMDSILAADITSQSTSRGYRILNDLFGPGGKNAGDVISKLYVKP